MHIHANDDNVIILCSSYMVFAFSSETHESYTKQYSEYVLKPRCDEIPNGVYVDIADTFLRTSTATPGCIINSLLTVNVNFSPENDLCFSSFLFFTDFSCPFAQMNCTSPRALHAEGWCANRDGG